MRDLTAEAWLLELRARCPELGIRRVVFRKTRSTIFSVTRGGSVLNLNASFRAAPPELLDDLAVILRGGRARENDGTRRRALRRIRAWQPLVESIRRNRTAAQANGGLTAGCAGRLGHCCATPDQAAYLRGLYAALNARHFGACLPAGLPVRLSARMRRRLGQIRLIDGPPRRIPEIALSADLLLEPNDRQLVDTLLHEMAHAEAFLLHGHRGHGPIWRRIAVRVGCEPRACTAARIVRRVKGAPATQRLPSSASGIDLQS